MIRKRTIDPEPITIFMAIVGTYAATVASINFARTHWKPLPSRVRERILKTLAGLADHVKHLRTDIEIIQGIFRSALYPKRPTMQLGHGAYLTPSEFWRYEKVSDDVFRRLRAVHKLSLRLERGAANLSGLEMSESTNVLGETYSRMERILDSRNLAVDSAWNELRAVAEGVERAIESLRGNLDPGHLAG